MPYCLSLKVMIMFSVVTIVDAFDYSNICLVCLFKKNALLNVQKPVVKLQEVENPQKNPAVVTNKHNIHRLISCGFINQPIKKTLYPTWHSSSLKTWAFPNEDRSLIINTVCNFMGKAVFSGGCVLEQHLQQSSVMYCTISLHRATNCKLWDMKAWSVHEEKIWLLKRARLEVKRMLNEQISPTCGKNCHFSDTCRLIYKDTIRRTLLVWR